MSRISIDAFNEIAGPTAPFVALFGGELTAIAEGRATVRVPFKEEFIRPGGTISGPVLMAAADLAMYAAVMSLVGPEALAVTTNLNANFIRKPADRDVYAYARIIKAGRRLVYGDVSLVSEGDQEPVAHVTCTYSLPPVKCQKGENDE